MSDLEVPESVRFRVFYAARDGLAITMYALLSENRVALLQLLNEVREELLTANLPR